MGVEVINLDVEPAKQRDGIIFFLYHKLLCERWPAFVGAKMKTDYDIDYIRQQCPDLKVILYNQHSYLSSIKGAFKVVYLFCGKTTKRDSH